MERSDPRPDVPSHPGGAPRLTDLFFRRPNVPTALALLGGVLLTLLLFLIVRESESDLLETQFRWRASSHAAALRQGLSEDLEVLSSLAALFRASLDVSWDEFTTFVSDTVGRHQDIRALAWIPRVSAAERQQFVQAARQNGFPEYQIREGRLHGPTQVAGQRPVHFPIHYLSPLAANPLLLGFDLAAHPRIAEILAESRDRGERLTTERIAIPGPEEAYEVLIVQPVYAGGMPPDTVAERRAALQGFVAVLFRVGRLVEEALEDRVVAGLDIALHDASAPAEESFLYLHPSRSRTMPILQRRMDLLQQDIPLLVPGREWTITFTAAPAFYAQFSPWRSWGILLGGLLFALASTLYLRGALSHAERERALAARQAALNDALSREVEERRQAQATLRRREAQLMEAQRIAALGSMELDARSGETSWSGELYRILGYAPESLPPSWQAFLARTHPEDRELLSNRFDEALTAHQGFTLDCRIVRAGGGERYVRTQGEFTAEAGNGERFVLTVQDITERKSVESLLRQSHDTLSTILNNLDVVVYVVDMESDELLFVNQYARRVFGQANPDLWTERQLMTVGKGTTGVYVWEARNALNGRWYECRDQPITWRDGRLVRLEIAVDITERKRMDEQIRHVASHDPLTGLPNRPLFMDRATVALARARRMATLAAILFIDLDGFKEVNDSLGHEAGDLVLREVAERLHRAVRSADTVARFGGDEFAMILTDVVGRSGVIKVAESVLTSIAHPYTVLSREARLTASIGIALFPHDGDTPEQLLKRADDAMYAAKGTGKNRWEFASEELELQ